MGGERSKSSHYLTQNSHWENIIYIKLMKLLGFLDIIEIEEEREMTLCLQLKVLN